MNHRMMRLLSLARDTPATCAGLSECADMRVCESMSVCARLCVSKIVTQ